MTQDWLPKEIAEALESAGVEIPEDHAELLVYPMPMPARAGYSYVWAKEPQR